MARTMEILIQRWLSNGVIDEPQADRMRTDVREFRKERSSRKLVAVFATVGALLLGVGAFLFMAANWTAMSAVAKVIVMVSATAGAYYGGYVLRYEKANFPLVGNALLFLGSILFGASIFLIAQIYHVNANNHVLVMIWILGILPLIYYFQNRAIAGLSTVLFYLWIGLFVFRGFTVGASQHNFIALPSLYLVSSVLVFSLGGIHAWREEWQGCARVCRLISIKAAMGALFLLTFKAFSGHWHSYLNAAESLTQVTVQFSLSFALFLAGAVVAAGVRGMLDYRAGSQQLTEGMLSAVLLVLTGVFFYFPSVTNVYTLLFNLVFAAMVFVLLLVGHRNEDIKLVNIGMSTLAVFIMSRYFDFFWSLMPRSLFFMVGGLLLVIGGLALERKRRELSVAFAQPQGEEGYHA